MAAIDVRELTKTFVTGRRGRREITAVADVSFSLGSGERLAFIGPNGAGKSTSIKMLTGILHPTRGHADVLGLTPWTQRRELARQIGTLFGQRSQLWAELPPWQSFRMLAAIFDLDDGEAVRRAHELGELFEAVELFDQPVRSQSLGQRMRCELTACMLHDPKILFLDEPTIGLDLLAKQRFRELLVRINDERGTTIFLTSHDVADIEYVAERMIVVNHGAIIYDAPVASMRRHLLAGKVVEIGLDRPVDDRVVAAVTGTGVVLDRHTPSSLHLHVDTNVRSIGEVVNILLSSLPVADLSVVDPPLEEVIAGIYEAPEHEGEAVP